MEKGKDIKGFVDRFGVFHEVNIASIGDSTARVTAMSNDVAIGAETGSVDISTQTLRLNIADETGGIELSITPKEAANLYNVVQDPDGEPIEGSSNIVTSDGIYCALDGKMDTPLRVRIFRDAESSDFEITGSESDFEEAVKQSRYFAKIVVVEVADSVYHDTKYYTGLINSTFTDAEDYVYVELTIGDYLFTIEAQCQGGEDFNWANSGTLVLTKREFIISE